MGSYLSRYFEVSSEEHKKFTVNQLQINCERQLQTRRQAAEKQMAMEIAVGREQFKYFGSFCALTGVGLLAASIKKKRPSLLAPMVPLGFLVAYQYDVAYGTFQMRVLGEAENVIMSEHHRLGL